MIKHVLASGIRVAGSVFVAVAAAVAGQAIAANAAASVPGTATLTSWSAGDSSASFCWSPAPANGASIDEYQPFVSVGSGWIFMNQWLSAATTCTTITGLTNGTTYALSVRAHNSKGWGGQSGDAPGRWVTPHGVPSSPGTPSVSGGDGSATVWWGTPSGTGIDSYKVLIDGATETEVGNTNSYAPTGLSNDTHSFQVAAHNDIGWSDWSSAGTAALAGPPLAPGQPTATRGDRSIAVTWPEANANGATIDSYELSVANSGTTAYPAGTTAATVSGLLNGSDYSVTVRAHNARGWSSWSVASAAVTPATVPDQPAAPNVTAKNGTVDLAWTRPEPNGSPLTSIEIAWSSDSGSTWVSEPQIVAGTATATTVAGLANGTAYTFRIRAVNAVGTGAWSPASAAVIPAGPPDVPGTPEAVPGDGQAEVSWTASNSNGATVSYQLATSSDDGASWGSPVSSGDTTLTAAGLANGTAYRFRVRGVNAKGVSPWSEASARVTPAGPPAVGDPGPDPVPDPDPSPADPVPDPEDPPRPSLGGLGWSGSRLKVAVTSERELSAGTITQYRYAVASLASPFGAWRTAGDGPILVPASRARGVTIQVRNSNEFGVSEVSTVYARISTLAALPVVAGSITNPGSAMTVFISGNLRGTHMRVSTIGRPAGDWFATRSVVSARPVPGQNLVIQIRKGARFVTTYLAADGSYSSRVTR